MNGKLYPILAALVKARMKNELKQMEKVFPGVISVNNFASTVPGLDDVDQDLEDIMNAIEAEAPHDIFPACPQPLQMERPELPEERELSTLLIATPEKDGLTVIQCREAYPEASIYVATTDDNVLYYTYLSLYYKIPLIVVAGLPENTTPEIYWAR